MILNEQGKPSMAAVLAHHGVKGMKWGVRKAHSTTAEIRDARIRQHARGKRLQSAVDNLNLASAGSNKAQQKAAVKKFQTAQKDFLTNEDRVTAARITTGEKVTQAILLGPLALATIPLSNAHARSVEKATDRARAASG